MKAIRMINSVGLVALVCVVSAWAQQDWEATSKALGLKADWGKVAETAQQWKRHDASPLILKGDALARTGKKEENRITLDQSTRPRWYQRIPPGFTVLAGNPAQARRAAILVHDRDLPALNIGLAPYDVVLGFRIADSIQDPTVEGRRFRETLNAASDDSGVQFDAWAEGLAGLVLRYAIERVTRERPPIQRLILVDTPNRGLSPSGWPAWAPAQPASAVQLPSYAVAGSLFLLELNNVSIADLSSVEYITVWRDTSKPAPRATVMQFPRRGVQIILSVTGESTALMSLLNAPVIVARTVPEGGIPVRTQPDSPESREEEARRNIAQSAGIPPLPLRAFLDGGIPDVLSRNANLWLRFDGGGSANASKLQQWRGQAGDRNIDSLAGITNPVTIAYEINSNEIVITGYADYAREPLTADIFWTALRARAARGYPGVSIDPPNAADKASGAVVRYVGNTGGTLLGGIMFEADRVMKILALGKDNITGTAVGSGIEQHKSIAAAKTLSTDPLGTVWRLWFEPLRWHAREAEPLSATIDARMQCRWERMTPDYVPSKPIVEFTEKLTAEYSQYAREQPSFDQLDQAAALVLMAQWVVDANLDAVLGVREAAIPVSTPERTPLMDVSTESQSGPWLVVLRGGVTFCQPLRHVRDLNSRSRALTVAALRQRPPKVDVWEFKDGDTVMRAVAFSAKTRRPIVRSSTQARRQVLPFGIRNAKDKMSDPAYASDACTSQSFRLVGPVITKVFLDDGAEPPEVVLDGFGFGQEGQAIFNNASLRTPTWTPNRVVAALSSTPQAGTLILRAEGRESNPIIFSLVTNWERFTPVQITVTNRSDFPLRVELKPMAKGSNRKLDLPSGSTQTTRVLPGRYTITAQATDQWTVAGTTREDVYESGRSYTITYDTSNQEFRLGEVVIRNDTGSPLTVEAQGPVKKSVTIPAGGPTTIRLTPGTYEFVVTARCGTQRQTVNVSRGSTNTLSYVCKTIIR